MRACGPLWRYFVNGCQQSEVASATIAGAWFFQLVLGIVPCPLCLEQRYAYYLIIPFAVLIAVAASRGVPRPLLVLGFAVLSIAAIVAFGVRIFNNLGAIRRHYL